MLPVRQDARPIQVMRTTVVAVAIFISAFAHGALYFNGASTVQVKDCPALHLLHGLTLEAWIRPDPGMGSRQSFAYILSRNYDDGGYEMLTRRTPLMGVEAFGWSAWAYPEGTIKPDRWSHVAICSDNKIAKLYINGNLIGTQKISHPLREVNLPLWIGGSPFVSGQSSCNWIGKLADVAIWSTPLDQRQVRRSMRSILGHERHLAAFFPLDEHKGMVARDVTGHTGGGVLSGNSDQDPGAPNWCEFRRSLR
jgi:hypothetical protein